MIIFFCIKYCTFEFFRYDEGKCFYSTTKISQNRFPLIYTLPPNNHENLRLCILKLVGQWSTSTINDYLRSPNGSNIEHPSSAIRILETLLKQALLPFTHSEGSLFYRNQHAPDEALPDGYELRLGFFQSLCLTQKGLTLNLQTTLTKFYPHEDILEFLTKILKKDIRKHGMNTNDYEKAKKALNGCKIATIQSNYTQVSIIELSNYNHTNYHFYLKIYQIRSFSDIPERQEFECTEELCINGKKTNQTVKYNLVQYYAKKNIKLDYPRLRCLQCFFLHDRKDPKHLPMELCRILEWQECEREVCIYKSTSFKIIEFIDNFSLLMNNACVRVVQFHHQIDAILI